MRSKSHKVASAMELPVIQVTWEDAAADFFDEADLGTPSEVADFGQTILITDVGYLIRWNSNEVVLAVSKCNAHNSVRHSNVIPRDLVREVTVLAGELPCPMTALLPVRRVRTTTSRSGSRSTSARISPSTTACSTTKPPEEPSK